MNFVWRSLELEEYIPFKRVDHTSARKTINERERASEKREYGLEECSERDEIEDRVQGATDLQISGGADKRASGDTKYSLSDGPQFLADIPAAASPLFSALRFSSPPSPLTRYDCEVWGYSLLSFRRSFFVLIIIDV